MKEKISVLMDGEMFEDDAELFFDKLKRHPQTSQDWAMYHLIGDALRQPEHIHRDVSAAFHERLQAEPTILAPQSRAPQRMKHYALSAAASLMALALVAWMSLQIDKEPAPQLAAAQQSDNVVRPASFQSNDYQSNDYLMAHQEFSPSADVQGAASYIHSVEAK
ncbi:MAG: sigma-E factor negative regulatory protein [Sideroxydans sp.]|nr:sigma-E factor negative regulatory protein [Sideroxydans sp.]NOT98386.1 sigma-E factor negative regulatory protein [Sideroxydans sp.]